MEELLLNAESVVSRTRSVKPNAHVDNIKRKTKIYSSYFIQQFKKTDHAYNRGESDFTSSLVSIILFTALVTNSLFLFTTNSYWSNSPIFLSFFMDAFLLTIFIIGLVIFPTFLISSFFGPQNSFKTILVFTGDNYLHPLF